jgi:hypothetical protein
MRVTSDVIFSGPAYQSEHAGNDHNDEQRPYAKPEHWQD